MLSRICSIMVVLGVAVLIGVAATAEDPDAKSVIGERAVAAATEDVGSSYLNISPHVAYERATLRIAGPEGVSLTRQFSSGDQIRVELFEESWAPPEGSSEVGDGLSKRTAALPDGRYRYEVRLFTAGVEVGVFAGLFFVQDGVAMSRAAVRSRMTEIRDDLVADGQSGDAVTKGYATTDFIYITDSPDDGVTWLVMDSDSPTPNQYMTLINFYGDLFVSDFYDFPNPFLSVGRNGRVGINTANPGDDLEIFAYYPSLRLTNTSPAQIWDIEVDNAGNFQLRDSTAFTQPFQIEDGGAPSGTMWLDSTGNVGIGTTGPSERLHVFNGVGNASLLFDSAASANFFLNRGNTSSFSRFVFETNGSLKWSMGMVNDVSDNFTLGPNASTSFLFVNHTNGRVGIGTKTPAHPLQMASGAHVTAGGVWTNASSRKYKENIRDLDLEQALSALAGLNPVQFNYKNSPEEEYVGFIAEDVPELVATGDRDGLSPMDLVGVLTKVVQEQQATIEALTQRIEQLESE